LLSSLDHPLLTHLFKKLPAHWSDAATNR
jgi:hypothetical protein